MSTFKDILFNGGKTGVTRKKWFGLFWCDYCLFDNDINKIERKIFNLCSGLVSLELELKTAILERGSKIERIKSDSSERDGEGKTYHQSYSLSQPFYRMTDVPPLSKEEKKFIACSLSSAAPKRKKQERVLIDTTGRLNRSLESMSDEQSREFGKHDNVVRVAPSNLNRSPNKIQGESDEEFAIRQELIRVTPKRSRK